MCAAVDKVPYHSLKRSAWPHTRGQAALTLMTLACLKIQTSACCSNMAQRQCQALYDAPVNLADESLWSALLEVHHEHWLHRSCSMEGSCCSIKNFLKELSWDPLPS